MVLYQRFAKSALIHYEVKHSRFIGCAAPFCSEEEAKNWIQTLKKQYWDATHVIYAYCFYKEQVQKFTDAGEPQGTAGLPVFRVLQNFNVSDSALAVIRYYGGTPLGKSGLVKAYAKAATAAAEAAGLLKVQECLVFKLTLPYFLYDTIQKILKHVLAVQQDCDFTDQVSLTAAVPVELWPKLQELLKEKYYAAVKYEHIDTKVLPEC